MAFPAPFPAAYHAIVRDIRSGITGNLSHVPPNPADPVHEASLRLVATSHGYFEEPQNTFTRSDTAWVNFHWSDAVNFSFPLSWISKVIFVDQNPLDREAYLKQSAAQFHFQMTNKFSWNSISYRPVTVYEFERLP